MTRHTVDIAVFAAISFLVLIADGRKRHVAWNGLARRRFGGLAVFVGDLAGIVAGFIAGFVAGMVGRRWLLVGRR